MATTERTIRVKPEDITVLMGGDARLSGSLKARTDNGCKRFEVNNWASRDDSLAWAVDVAKPGEYEVSMLASGRDAEIEITAGNTRLIDAVNFVWDRKTVGSLDLPGGVSTITMHATKPGEDLELYSLELVHVDAKKNIEKKVRELRSSTKWMVDAQYGLQFHWTSMSQPRYGEKKPYADAARDFNVDAFTDMVRETGAGYVILTTSHGEYYFPAPIKAIDDIMPGRTADRDLVSDLAEALGTHGIKLILYYHLGHGHRLEPDGWWERMGFDPADETKFIDNWCNIITEAGERYGRKLAGWWFDDGCVYYPLNPPFERMCRATKAGNPDRIICYNPWKWPRFTDFQDYFCGEGYDWMKSWEYLPEDGSGIYVNGPQSGLQAHTNFILERGWGHFTPNSSIPPPAIDRETFVRDMQNATKRGIVPSVNMEVYQDGTASPESLDFMRAVRKAIKG